MSPGLRLTPVLLLLLAGCAGQDTRAPTAVDWADHSGRLQQLRQWTASGKVALRSSERAESASLEWQQRDHNTRLQLSGPVGVGTTIIHSDGQLLTIQQGGELTTLDISTQGAVLLNTGWDLPLQALPHWLKGISSPDFSVQLLELDPQTGWLSSLRQDDWEIHYRQYSQFADFTLPTRLEIRRGDTSARLIIRHWDTRTE